MRNDELPACSLSGSKLVERKREWAKVAARATSHHVERDRIISTYPPDQQLLRQIRKLIDAEGDCCSFMQFNVEERPEQFVVELRVPEEMSDVLADTLGLLAQPAGTMPKTGSA